jgi:TolB protein
LPKPVQVRGTILYYKLEFHPDGKKLLGVFRAEGKDHGLAWFDVESGAFQSVLQPPAWGRYALSPDGRWSAYTQTMDEPGQQGGNNGPQADLWKIPADGGKPEKIIRFPSRIHDLCWRADNRSVIVVSELGGAHYDLWEVPVNSRRDFEKLTFGQADEDRPSLSKDDLWLVYTDNRSGPTGFVVRDQQTGEERTVAVDRLDFRKPTGTIRLLVRDAGSKKAMIARISLQKDKGKYYAPPGSLYRILRDYGHFYCDGSAKWSVPAGKYRLRAFRGPEYKPADQVIDIVAGQTRELTVDLERWTYQAKEGWYSGENHIHANYGYGQWYNTPASMFQQCSGEDLNVCNFMVANSDTDGVFDRAFFRGRPDPLSTSETILYWNQEFRSTLWGHMTLVNLRQVVEPIFTGFKDTTNPWDIPTNSDIAERTHWQKGHVNYTHVAQNPDDPFTNPYAGKGIPIDVALGKIDSLDINASYAGTVPIWHRLLNCGFRLPASAGTDCFLNRIYSQLPGGDRVYVKVDGPFSYDSWIKGLKAGRSFVSNGPVLQFTVDKKYLGDTVALSASAKVKVRAISRSQFPLDKVEIIYNGKVLLPVSLAKDKLTAEFEGDILLDKSGWLSVRAQGPGPPASALTSLYAITSPIYVEVGKAPTRSRDDALFFLAWIDRLSVALRERNRIPNDTLRRQVQEQLDAARAVYERLALKKS